MVDLMKAGGFRLTKFISNKENVMETILEMERAKSLQVWTFNSDIKERTLSIKGDVVKDSFKFESLMLEREVTKRAILKIVASIFDPLGLVSPFVLTAKIFLQELWSMKLDYDTIIDNNVKRKWKKWQGELKNVSKVEIAWVHLIGYTAPDIELHVFVMPQRRHIEVL